MRKIFPFLVAAILLYSESLFGGTTGKIAGRVTDAETGEPLPAVNVIVAGTNRGAATDINGYYTILNMPPGKYTLKASYIGYAPYQVTDVVVQIDLTTTINMQLKTETVQGEEVVIVAERPVVVKDVSASQANISIAQIEAVPAALTVTDVIGLQAGILGLSVRGGGSDQTAFMVDGFTLRDERNNTPFTGVSLSAVQEVQVQTGGFNAEYGNIRSGIVNVVTKDGDRKRYSGQITYRHRPAAPKHFGMSFQDPNSYWLRPYLDPEVAWTGTRNGAWDENTQRQYPQFDGWNTISERTLQDDDPSNDLTPTAAQRLFLWQHRRQVDINKPDFNLDGGFGGPVPFGEALGNLRFFTSFRKEQTQFLVPFSRSGFSENNFMLKLTSDISDNIKLTMTGLYNEIFSSASNDVGAPGIFKSTTSVASVLSRVGFIDSRIFYDSYWAKSDIVRNMLSAKLTHILSPTTFYELVVERVATDYTTVPNADRDTSRVYEVFPGYFADEAPFGRAEFIIYGIDGLLMGVRANARDFSKISTLTTKFDISSQVNNNNLVKAGVEVVINNFDMKFGAINTVLPAARPWTEWQKTPVRAAVYVQDKLEFKGFISNIGLRLDYIDPRGTWWNVDPYDRSFFSTNYNPELRDTFEQKQVKKQFTLSPRLGISHPITENSKFYFNYGQFRQMPQSDRLYTERRITGNQLNRLGDPNLPLQKTVAYELGYEHSIGSHYLLRVAGYYKDISDQSDLTRFISSDGKVNYFKATNNSYEDIRGFELTLDKRLGRWLTGFANYTYMVSTYGLFGIGTQFENPAEQRDYLRDNPPFQRRPVPRPYARINLLFHTPRDFGQEFMGFKPLADWQMSFLGTWREGAYLTWNPANVPGIENNVQMPDYKMFDFRLSRIVKFGRGQLDLFLDIRNVFNIKNFTLYGFVDGRDYSDYMTSLRLPRDVAEPIGVQGEWLYGDDRIGDLRPEGVAYDPLESNPNNDPEIAARNARRIASKSYIDNPNQSNLMYLNPRDIYFGAKLTFNLN